MNKNMKLKSILLLCLLSVAAKAENLNSTYGYLSDMNLQDNYNIRRTIRSDIRNGMELELGEIGEHFYYLNSRENFKGELSGKSKNNMYIGSLDKQITKEGRLGFIFGGGESKVDFSNPVNIKRQNAVVGGYYNYKLTDRLSALSMITFDYSHNSVKIENRSSTSPTMSMTVGTNFNYILSDDFMKVALNGGIDWSKVLQGTYNDSVANTNSNTEYYDSVRPNIGISATKDFVVANKKGKLGLDISYEKELGNIKNEKTIWAPVGKRNKIASMKHENMVNLGVNGNIDLTNSLNIGASYNKMISEDYDLDLYGVNFQYKLEKSILSDYNGLNFLDKDKRFRVTANVMLETEDYDDNSAGNAGTTSIQPRIILTINDKKSSFMYLMDAFYKTEEMFGSSKAGEGKDTNRRINPQINWKGMNVTENLRINGYVGWRNQVRKQTNSTDGYFRQDVNSYRMAPGLSYKINNELTFFGSTLLAKDEVADSRKGTDYQYSYWAENIYGLRYNLTKNWVVSSILYRLDKKYVKSTNKKGENTQFRPVIRYNFAGGSYAQLQGRFSLDGGERVENRHGIVSQYNAETRYVATFGYKINDYFTTYSEVTMNSFKRYNKSNNTPDNRISRTMLKVGFIYGFDI